MKALLLSFAAGVLAAACASSGPGKSLFSPTLPRESGLGILGVEEKLRSAPRPPGVPVAVGVTDRGLVGAALPSGRPWSVARPVESLPAVTAPGVVVATGGGRVFGVDGANGRLLFDVSADDYELGGAADDGHFTVVTLAKKGRSQGRLVVVERGDHVVLDVDTDMPLGRPGIIAGVAFVPWRGQYVSAIDVKSGEEIARALVRDLVSHAIDFDGALYFGERALVRFDQKIRYAESFQATRFTFTPRQLPGKPVWLGSGVEPSRIDRTALAKIRLFAAPDPETGKPAGGAYAATYFRVIYGFSVPDNALAFTDALPADALGGAAAASGFAFCDASGRVHFDDPEGRAGAPLSLGAPLVACSVGASALRVSASRERGTLTEQIEHTISSVDATMAAAEGLLIGELGKISDPAVTQGLIAFAESS